MFRAFRFRPLLKKNTGLKYISGVILSSDRDSLRAASPPVESFWRERGGVWGGERGPFFKKGPTPLPNILPYPLTNSTKYAMTVPKRITTSIHLRSTGEMHFWNFAPKYMPSNPPRLRSRAMPQSGAMLRSG